MSSYLRTEQAAVYLSCSRSFLEKLRLTPNGPRFIKMGRNVLYEIEDLVNWAENRKVLSTSEALHLPRINGESSHKLAKFLLSGDTNV